MEEISNNLVAQYGALGILIIILITGIVYGYKRMIKMDTMHKEERVEWAYMHKDERAEWVDTYKEQSNKSTEAIINNTAALSKIEGKLS